MSGSKWGHKTKHMLATSRDIRRFGSQITADNYDYDIVKEFFLPWLRRCHQKMSDSLEIKQKITFANRCYFGVSRHLSSRDLSRTTKLILYKRVIFLVFLSGAKAWTLLSSDAASLRVFVRKILHKIYSLVRVDDDLCMRSNIEMYEVLSDIGVGQRINIQR